MIWGKVVIGDSIWSDDQTICNTTMSTGKLLFSGASSWTYIYNFMWFLCFQVSLELESCEVYEFYDRPKQACSPCDNICGRGSAANSQCRTVCPGNINNKICTTVSVTAAALSVWYCTIYMYFLLKLSCMFQNTFWTVLSLSCHRCHQKLVPCHHQHRQQVRTNPYESVLGIYASIVISVTCTFSKLCRTLV